MSFFFFLPGHLEKVGSIIRFITFEQESPAHILISREYNFLYITFFCAHQLSYCHSYSAFRLQVQR